MIRCAQTVRENVVLEAKVKSKTCRLDSPESTGGGLDVPADIRQLKERMCMIHFKDGQNYLGDGKIKMEPLAEALHAINYKGWIVLETANPSKNAVADCKRNGDYIRKLMGR